MPQRNKDRNCVAGKGNGEEAGAGYAAYLLREVWVLADLIRTTVTAKAVKLARRKNRSAKRGAKYFAGNWRDCEQGQYPWVLAARRRMEGCRNGIKTEIARRERETARKRARDLRHICAGSVDISRPHTNDRSGKSGKTSAAEKQERETRSEILCGELVRRRARSIPVGISCSQTCELTQRKRSAPALPAFPPRI